MVKQSDLSDILTSDFPPTKKLPPIRREFKITNKILPRSRLPKCAFGTKCQNFETVGTNKF